MISQLADLDDPVGDDEESPVEGAAGYLADPPFAEGGSDSDD